MAAQGALNPPPLYPRPLKSQPTLDRVGVSGCERERGRQGEGARERGKEGGRERERGREGGIEREREREGERERERERERDRGGLARCGAHSAPAPFECRGAPPHPDASPLGLLPDP